MATQLRPAVRPRALWARSRGPVATLVPLFLGLLLSACGGIGPARVSDAEIPPLQLEDRIVDAGNARQQVATGQLLEVDADMRAFVRRHTQGMASRRQRLVNLHRAVKGGGLLDIRYDPFAEGSASDAFHRGSANCLSYANLMVALAREAGLKANYHWQEVRPEWTRMGEQVAVRLHVNVLVTLPGGEQYMADIDPLESQDVADTRVLSDREAEALYHANLAMSALAEHDLETAYLRAVRAVQLAPEMNHLWVNLGVVYRVAGQQREAEDAYLYALQRDPGDRSAMNNLVVLYELQGRDAERDYWEDRVLRYREKNPYYHATLGDEASAREDWQAALGHYQQAVKLRPEDSRLLYATGLLHYRLGEYAEADRLITDAIGRASRKSDIEVYRLQLQAVRQEQLAGSTAAP